jgi:hypothetical protein
MRSGSGRSLLLPEVGQDMITAGMLPGCWKLLPEETADFVEVPESAPASADVTGAPSESCDPAVYRQTTATVPGAPLAAGSGSTNQLLQLYKTDEDGQALVPPETKGGFSGIIKVLAVDKLRPLPAAQSNLQGKDFQLSCLTRDDNPVIFPVPIFRGNIYCTGNLGDTDFTDPRW